MPEAVKGDAPVHPGVRVQIGTFASPVLTALEPVNFRLDVKEKRIILGAVRESIV